MAANVFAKRWDNTLRIKHIFMGDDVPELPDAADTIRMAGEVAAAVRKLRDKIGDPALWNDLDYCVDALEALDGIENAWEARDRFNAAISELYDVGDYAKRIWIE